MKSFVRNHLPVVAPYAVLIVLFATASLLYPRFFSARVLGDLFNDNAFLGIAAAGMTLVILSGGIDLSVGSLLAFTTIFVATLVQKGLSPLVVIPLGVTIGALFGLVMGFLIHRYELPPFLVTLGGMFFARGLAFVVNKESLGIAHPIYSSLKNLSVPLGPRGGLNETALFFIFIFILAAILTHFTRFGRNVYALGGSESSARLLGIPIGRTKMAVYALSGLCSSLAGVIATFYMGSGNPAMGAGFELDVIASVVIGGTLLTGGVGSQLGTLAGVLIFGTIQTTLVFDGRLNSWWQRIAVGLLLLGFILFQKVLSRRPLES
jgi:galactofuranose transport system permease protein